MVEKASSGGSDVTFEEAMREAARAASQAADSTMQMYKHRNVVDEDDITGVLVGQLQATFKGARGIGGLIWNTTILRHRRGLAAEERRVGADMLIHVELDTPSQQYSKGALIQAKRLEPGHVLLGQRHTDLVAQCNLMLQRTAAAFVFNYATSGMRCGAATRLAGSREGYVPEQCSWTAYRFFLELFRCPIGDPNIQSHLVEELPIPQGIHIVGRGELTSERG
jgi:hypothetical protein